MELEIVPDPPPQEREAIEAALERLAEEDRRDGAVPAWWRAGLPDDSDGLDAPASEL